MFIKKIKNILHSTLITGLICTSFATPIFANTVALGDAEICPLSENFTKNLNSSVLCIDNEDELGTLLEERDITNYVFYYNSNTKLLVEKLSRVFGKKFKKHGNKYRIILVEVNNILEDGTELNGNEVLLAVYLNSYRIADMRVNIDTIIEMMNKG